MVSIEYSSKDDRKPMVDIWGMSSNTKPRYKYGSLLMANASVYHEVDTSAVYRYDEAGQIWHKQKYKAYEDDKFVAKVKLWGLSTDVKPTKKYGSLTLTNGSVFTEMDTSDRYRYNEKTAAWYKQSPVSSGGGGGEDGGLDVDVADNTLIFTKVEED